jgi:hypothetical protein
MSEARQSYTSRISCYEIISSRNRVRGRESGSGSETNMCVRLNLCDTGSSRLEIDQSGSGDGSGSEMIFQGWQEGVCVNMQGARIAYEQRR